LSVTVNVTVFEGGVAEVYMWLVVTPLPEKLSPKFHV